MNFIKTKKFTGIIIILAFLCLGFLLYSNTLHSPFLFDDWPNILDNSRIRMAELTWESFVNVFRFSEISSVPLPTLSFAINYYFGHYNVAGYHIVNILIHVINAILLFFFLKTTIILSHKQDLITPRNYCLSAECIALFAALLWFVNPLGTQSVSYISQRMNSMAAMFYLLSFCFYLKGRLTQNQSQVKISPYAWFAGCFIFYICALLSKKITLILPFFIFLYEWYFFRDLNISWLKKNS